MENNTGGQLAAAIDALLIRRPDISKKRMGIAFYGCKHGVEAIRKAKWVRESTAEKVIALIENPPAEVLKIVPQRKGVRQQRQRLSTEVRGQRIAAGIRRSTMRKAQARIDAGLSTDTCTNAAIKWAQRDLEEAHRQRNRLMDPIEQAKTILRQARYVPVCSMGVYDGDPELFRVGYRCNISRAELLSMADAARKVAA